MEGDIETVFKKGIVLKKEIVSFVLNDELIYYIDPVNARRRLYIPKTLEKDIFSITYNEYIHAGFHRAYDIIIASVYIRNLSRRLKIYITHYPQCQLL